ncbi:hemolysin D [Brucella intermedia 229E]|uniref:Hemolysin D n=1 Tax=Brucella intermedia 229E TaxID=1337887 RepID=U4V7K9_9HYPH|nr:hemolysin D [Brucella intermedia 229E]
MWARSTERTATDNAYVRGNTTAIASKVTGYVTVVDVADNQYVRANDVLFRIDDRDFRARLAQAEANVEAAQAHIDNVEAEIQLQHILVKQATAQKRAAEADLALAVKASQRQRELVRTNSVSRAQVDESDAARSKAEAGLLGAKAAVEAQETRIKVLTTQKEAALAAVLQARAARDLARIDLDNTVVRAPFDGVIGNRQVRVGRLVSPPGASLIDLVPIKDVWIVANFKETQIESIQPGQSAQVTVDAYPGIIIEGKVDSFAPGSGSAFSLLPADNATGNFVRVVQRVPVKIKLVQNPIPGRLVPGLSARVQIILGSES